jgi:hypothetical protein
MFYHMNEKLTIYQVSKKFNKITENTWRFWHAQRASNDLIKAQELIEILYAKHAETITLYDSDKVVSWLISKYDRRQAINRAYRLEELYCYLGVKQ